MGSPLPLPLPVPVLSPLHWWQLAPVLAIERELFGADSWTAAVFWSELAQHDARHYLVATLGEARQVVGYGGLAAVADEAYIQTLAVTGAQQGRRVGAGLLDALLAEADRRGARSVGLEVRTDNTAALRLYERRGFVVVGTRRGYYQPSGADAHVMRRGGQRARH